ncbi:HupE/UreJ family protein [Pontiellaceae bacterium B1224]|nr:HupE/UreJ family protein [Pontiellaceae bacterium B1224]
MKRIWLFLVFMLTGFQGLEAHEMNSAYLELREAPDARCSLLLRIPDMLNMIELSFPAGTEPSKPTLRAGDGARLKSWTVHCPQGLAGSELRIAGLDRSDLLVRIYFMNGSEQTVRVPKGSQCFTIPAVPSQLDVAETYSVLGVEHILMGFDHLLFVLSLILLIHGTKKLIGAITMFTVAHSITLALATLGLVQVPSPPVEAVIALSIVFVAVEIIHGQQGRPGLTERAPWIVTLSFGLLHGLGFAGALTEVGLPGHAIPAALLFFNIGVEAGQLLFVALVLAVLWLLRKRPVRRVEWLPLVPAYLIGSIAMFWVFERVAGF